MIGIDIVKVSRFQDLIDRRGLDFVQKMLNTSSNDVDSLAAIFAAKEALGKALKTGINRNILKNAKLIREPSGAPTIYYNKKLYELSISHDAGIAVAVVSGSGRYEMDEKIQSLIKSRDQYGNKSSFGRLAIVAGSKKMTGAAALSANAAMRTGVGYTYLYVPEELISIMQLKTTEVIVDDIKNFYEDIKLNAIAIGPGIGYDRDREIINIFNICNKNNIPILVDADGFYYLKKYNLKANIITPHEMEAARLLDEDISFIKANREQSAIKLSKKYDVITLLKGKDSIITDGKEVFINQTGNSGLASAGTGDVLSGIISSLLAQGYDAIDAARLGSYIHGRAAEIYSEEKSEHSLIASDIIDYIGYIF